MTSQQIAWVLTGMGSVAFSSDASAPLPRELRAPVPARGQGDITTAEGRARVFVEHGGDRRVVVLSRASEALRSLTRRQIEVAEYAAVGATCREIARTLDISPHTVRQHMKRTYELLGVANRVELARALAVLE